MRFRGMSVTMMVGAVLLLALEASEASAQRGRIGVLRPAPRPLLGAGAGRARWATISPHFFNTCLIFPHAAFNPWFGGFPFINIQLFTAGQPVPDPSSHLVPDPGAQPVPVGGSFAVPSMQPVPGTQPVPGMQPAPGAGATNPHAVPAFAAPVYSPPVYTPPVYGAATPVATPHVNGGMVVGDVIVDPTFGLWGGAFFGGGVTCLPTRALNGAIIVR